MPVSNLEKQREKVCTEPNHLPTTAEELLEERANTTNEFQAKVKKAIEAFSLCYNCETGFHYMEQ